MAYLPDWNGSFDHLLVAIFLVLGPFFFLSEAHGGFAFGYSKFADREARFTLPSRLGMFLLYFPAVLLFPLTVGLSDEAPTTWHLVCAAMVSAHFGKRCLEALFIHKYSGVMNGFSVVMICGLYSTLSGLLGWIAVHDVPSTLLQSPNFTPLWIPGFIIWSLGTAINAYHPVLLANLRPPGETGYKVPEGGLFRWIACPHYLGELIAWWGFSLIFHHVAAFVVTLTMTFYLSGRAYNTLKWYRGKDLELPAGWKRLVPFVY